MCYFRMLYSRVQGPGTSWVLNPLPSPPANARNAHRDVSLAVRNNSVSCPICECPITSPEAMAFLKLGRESPVDLASGEKVISRA